MELPFDGAKVGHIGGALLGGFSLGVGLGEIPQKTRRSPKSAMIFGLSWLLMELFMMPSMTNADEE